MEKISFSSYLQQHSSINSREFDGETVMMDKSLENYFGLNEIGTRVWQILEKKHTLIELCEKLTLEYDVDKEQCLNDLKPFIEDLIKDELIIVSNGDIDR